ncbi:hypothetical protein ACFONH_22150 [Streptomonospora nanhaiensis]|uniref:Uncharacterized protein n=1 Tax=Streptomonospora nanhaiensis TaxID=1323731 RepID=A0A853BR38_9ACTN|nr:hypothetical protein [Streptomonospora nanhaiensis]NYI97858.1 hypothetical protein [Streptomonospora nanhaiensis]
MVDQVLIAIAAAVAGKAVEPFTEGAVDLLRRLRGAVIARFRRDPEPHAALEAAQIDYDDTEAVAALAAHIGAAAEHDPGLRRLVEELRPYFTSGGPEVVNTVVGEVSGNVVQARDIVGGIDLGR